MIFIIGGAYQGKKRYAAEKYGVKIIDGASADTEDIIGAECVSDFHEFIRRVIDSGQNPLEITGKIIRENPKIIIIMNEIGGGIVPVDKAERMWRERVGETGCYIAKCAERVERIICGTAVRIK